MYLGFASPGFGLHVLVSKPQCQGSDHYSGAFVTTGPHRPYLPENLGEAAVLRQEAL